MKKVFFLLLIAAVSTSCLKKISQVDEANTSLFDEEYTGDQWFIFEDVYTYTNSNNDLKVRLDYMIPAEYAPDLKPTGIKVEALVNGYAPKLDSAVVNNSGSYEGSVEYSPDGSSEYCLNLGIYINEEGRSINNFSECKSF